MSNGNADGDVLANKMSLMEAKGQRFLSSLLGPQPAAASSDSAKVQDEDADLKVDYGHDRIGVGGILPKDIEDGSFTRRAPTSNDKLLEQLIGKKRAKAHIAAKQEASRPNAKAQRYGKPAVQVKDDSEDEEEGRAGAFKSKRGKKNNSKPSIPKAVDSDDEDEETRAARLEGQAAQREEEDLKLASEDHQVEQEQPEVEKAIEEAEEVKTAPKRARAKPASFLDEILAERSKKKSKKIKG